MADITKAITAYLNTRPAITSLVDSRITPDTKPQNSEFPALSILVASGDSLQHIGGGSGIATETIQIESWSENKTQANSLAETVRQELMGFRGTMGGVFVRGVTLENTVDDSEDPVDGSNNYVYRRITDYEFVYSEATTTT